MYLLVVVISLLLNSVPTQSRPAEKQNLFEEISEETGNIEDDMPVSAEQQADGPLIMFGDIAVSTRLRNAVPCIAHGCKWERSGNRVYVPYVISKKYSPSDLEVIQQGLQSFADVSCIQFIPRVNQTDFLNIKSDTGCYSYLGRQGGEQVVSLSRLGCVHQATVQHELLHALGFHHEQSRSDRDEHIQILFENIKPGKEHNFMKTETNNLATPYDYQSLMHYQRYAFSSNRKPTLIPIPDGNVAIGGARSMSHNDILRINRLYCS